MIWVVTFVIELVILFFISRRVKRRIYWFLNRSLRKEKWANYIFAVLFLPGTIIHELSHLVTALLLLVRVKRIELMPKVDGKNLKLGSVAMEKPDIIRHSIVGISPFIFGTLLILLSVNYVFVNKLYADWLVMFFLVYGIFQVSNSMFLSRSDLKEALELISALVLFYIVLYIIGLRISWTGTGLYNDSLKELILRAVTLLLLPLFIDLSVLVLLPSERK
jgi:hypothetical protein